MFVGMDLAPRLLLVFLVLEAPRPSLGGCDLPDLCALSILVAREGKQYFCFTIIIF